MYIIIMSVHVGSLKFKRERFRPAVFNTSEYEVGAWVE